MISLSPVSVSEKIEKYYPVIGEYISEYDFSYRRKQCLRGDLIEHFVKGVAKIGISQTPDNYYFWNVLLDKIEIDTELAYIPEYYILWDCTKRTNFFVNKAGQLSTYRFQSFGNDMHLANKTKQINALMGDKDRKEAIGQVITKVSEDNALLANSINLNPVIKSFLREFEFRHGFNDPKNYNIKLLSKETSQNFPHYFAKNRNLYMDKKTILDNRNDKITVGSAVAGLNKERTCGGDFFNFMKMLAGKVQIGGSVLLDYSEYYQYNRPSFFYREEFPIIEHYIQTMVADAWFLEENISIKPLNR